MRCPNCDIELADNARFCVNCGTALNPAPENIPSVSSVPYPPTSGPIVPASPPASYSAPSQMYQGPPGPYVQPIATTSTNAVISFIAGIAGWTFLPVIGAIVAVIFGRMAKKEIRASNGMLQGEAFATIGLVIGSVELGLLVVGICGAVLLFFLQVAFRIWLSSSLHG